MKEAQKIHSASYPDLRQHVIGRLRHTTKAPRALIRIDLPPAAEAHFLRMPLRPAAVLVPLLDSGSELEVLLTQRSDSLRNHAGQISFPGGSRDADDRDVIETALREAREEINLAPEDTEIIGMLDDYPIATGFRVTPVVALVSGSTQFQPDGVEVTGLFRVPLAHVLDPDNYRSGTFVREGFELPFVEVRWGEHRIWGATAGMLRNLCDKLR